MAFLGDDSLGLNLQGGLGEFLLGKVVDIMGSCSTHADCDAANFCDSGNCALIQYPTCINKINNGKGSELACSDISDSSFCTASGCSWSGTCGFTGTSPWCIDAPSQGVCDTNTNNVCKWGAPPPPALNTFLHTFDGAVIDGAIFGNPFVEKNLAVAQNNELQMGGTSNADTASASITTTGVVNSDKNFNISADIVFTGTVAGDPVTSKILINDAGNLMGCSVGKNNIGQFDVCTVSDKGKACQTVADGSGTLVFRWLTATSDVVCEFKGQVATVNGVTKRTGGVVLAVEVPTSGDTVQNIIDNLDHKIGSAPPAGCANHDACLVGELCDNGNCVAWNYPACLNSSRGRGSELICADLDDTLCGKSGCNWNGSACLFSGYTPWCINVTTQPDCDTETNNICTWFASAPAPPVVYLDPFTDDFAGVGLNVSVYSAVVDGLTLTKNELVVTGGTASKDLANAGAKTIAFLNMTTAFNISANINVTGQSISVDQFIKGAILKSGPNPRGCYVSQNNVGDYSLCTVADGPKVCTAVTKGVGKLKFMWDPNTHIKCQFDGQEVVNNNAGTATHNSLILTTLVGKTGDKGEVTYDNLELEINPNVVIVPPVVLLPPFLEEFTGVVINLTRFNKVESGGLVVGQKDVLEIMGTANTPNAASALETKDVLNISKIFNVTVNVNLSGANVNNKVLVRVRDKGAVNKNGCQLELNSSGAYQLCIRYDNGLKGNCIPVQDGIGRLTYLWNPTGGEIYCTLDGIQTKRVGVTGGAGAISLDLVATDTGDQARVDYDNLELSYLAKMPPTPGGACETDEGCVVEEGCDPGVCKKTCVNQADCPPGKICALAKGKTFCQSGLQAFTETFTGSTINGGLFMNPKDESGLATTQNNVLIMSGTVTADDVGIEVLTKNFVDTSASFEISTDFDFTATDITDEFSFTLKLDDDGGNTIGCQIWAQSDGEGGTEVNDLCTRFKNDEDDDCVTPDDAKSGKLILQWDKEFNRVRCIIGSDSVEGYDRSAAPAKVAMTFYMKDEDDEGKVEVDNLQFKRTPDIPPPPAPESQVKNFVIPFQSGDSFIDTGQEKLKAYMGPGEMLFLVYTSYYTPSFTGEGEFRVMGTSNQDSDSLGAIYRYDVNYYMPFKTTVDIDLKDTSSNLVGNTVSAGGISFLNSESDAIYQAVVALDSSGNYNLLWIDGEGIQDTILLPSGKGHLEVNVNEDNIGQVLFDEQVLVNFEDFDLKEGYNPALSYQIGAPGGGTDGKTDINFDNWNFMVATKEALDCSSLDQEQCEGHDFCYYRDMGEFSICEERECYDLMSQNECNNAKVLIGTSCDWDASVSSIDGWCERTNCFSLEGQGKDACESNGDGLACNYVSECSGRRAECWSEQDVDTCNSMEGCFWGRCEEKGCWNYWNKDSCEKEGNVGINGRTCVWNQDWNSCIEPSCWDLDTKTNCQGSALGCLWDSTYKQCSEKSCESYDFTDTTACEVTSGLDCKFDVSTSRCDFIDCSSKNEAQCGVAAGCSYKKVVGDVGGTCRKFDCWDYEDLGSCEADGDCVYDNIRKQCSRAEAKKCSGFVNEMNCLNTNYCFWDGVDCKDPEGQFTGIFDGWNPGCYIFDSTSCAKVSGCTYDSEAKSCITEVDHDNEDDINEDGVDCSFITDVDLCTGLTSLSTCCDWVGTGCAVSYDPICKTEKEELPFGIKDCLAVGAVTTDDNAAKNLCEQIKGSPWFAHCLWDGSTGKCEFDEASVFGDKTPSLAMIDNKDFCEYAAGTWVDDFYCEGTNKLPAGRCENKAGDDETNCNEKCFACEKDFDGKAHPSVSVAKEYCFDSDLGYCQFVEDSTAPNGFGYCNVKEEFKTGVASDCKSNCASCTYMGNPAASSVFDGNSKSYKVCNTPECYCTEASNYGQVSCKWVPDSDSSVIGGYCIDDSERTCWDDCSRCYDQIACVNDGKTVSGVSGLCQWSGSIDGFCESSLGEKEEICWNGDDDDGDGDIDCGDSGCFADSSCGLVSGGCMNYITKATCEADPECIANEDYGGFICGPKGADCYLYDGDETSCTDTGYCDFNLGSGDHQAGCKTDWSLDMTCVQAGGEDACEAVDGCAFKKDEWCDTPEGAFDWWCVDGNGGWCNSDKFSSVECWRLKDKDVCNAEEGCNFMSSDWGEVCEVDWSKDCPAISDKNNCDSESACNWKIEGDSSWCEGVFEGCFRSNEEECNNLNECVYNNWQKQCEPSCFSLSNGECSSTDGCLLTGGWCEQDMSSMSGCEDIDNLEVCAATSGCKAEGAGRCNPPGFMTDSEFGEGMGGGGEVGSLCWEHDGDKTACESKADSKECIFIEEQNAFCDVDWTSYCWENWNSGDCVADGCSWDAVGEYCKNKFDDCHQIQDSGTCNGNANCKYDAKYGCEPICFSLNSADCATTSGCNQKSGWCEPPGMMMFEGMEAGVPVSIASDFCGDDTDHLDICEVGVKDMGDAFGFGATVTDMAAAGICNNKKIGFDGVVMGKGEEDLKYYVYLDTDGEEEGGCASSEDINNKGFEFMLKLDSIWNDDSSRVDNTFTAYKCKSNKLVKADIGLSAWDTKMCSEIMGPMIAVEKMDLEKYPSLYDAGVDMRVYVATSDGEGDAGSPVDVAGPGWVSPGSIDFALDGMFEYGGGGAQFESVMQKGYVEYEDCFNGIDDNNNDKIDCFDWGCGESKVCENVGVNAPSYVDNSAPKISGLKVEEYTDSVMVMYNSDRPTEGTLYFYSTDSTCSGTPTKIYDPGLISDNMKSLKMWHMGEIYNDGGVNSLDEALAPGKSYYYKLEIVDKNGNTAKSKCEELVTSNGRCPYCKFVTKISAPEGWTVSYDLDTDGVYEHVQDAVCGPNAGMKTDYESGRSANVMLADDSGNKFIFNDVHLTKTGLTSETRDIQSDGALIASTVNDVPLIGMASGTRDKIINNLHPDSCQIRIPTSSDCSELWHCDDSGANCINRDDATLALDESSVGFCTWQIPYCEFSTWASGDPEAAGPVSSGDSGGSGGSGGGASVGSSTVDEEEEEETISDFIIGEEDEFGSMFEFGDFDIKPLEFKTPEVESTDWFFELYGLWITLGILSVMGILYVVVSRVRR